MQRLSTLDTIGPIDYENLNIIIQPRPPRRRQSGTSLIPFRPYVKSLTSVREPFSYADGTNTWKTMGNKETFFKQQNARCIGSLIDDCDVSEVIRWDIEGESTRLPMMCKLWIIVDGAVVERGKPRLVQDAAIQVYTAGRNHRSILEAEQRYTQLPFSSINRRRRHSWHDVNEYHSVPYFQYTRAVKSGYQESIQCDMDNEHVKSKQEYLSFITEETVDENQLSRLEEQKARETVHNQSILKNRVQVSSMTQTENQFADRSTEIDSDFARLYNMNILTNEAILSSVVNPYVRQYSSYYSGHTTKTFRNGIEYTTRSVSTGDDYPQWWLQLSTNVLLSDRVTNQGEEKKKYMSAAPSPRQLDQSSQTDTAYNSEVEIERTRPSSTRSSRLQKTSSSMTLDDNYEVIDQVNDGNNSRRMFPYQEQRQRIDSDSRLSDYQIETLSNRDYGRLRCTTSLSKQSDPDYNTFALALNQQSYSTPDPYTVQTTYCNSSLNDTNRRIRTDNPSTNVLATLLERYERTLRERQRAITVVNNQLLDIDDVLNHYRQKIENSDRGMELYRDITTLSSQAKEVEDEVDPLPSSLTMARLTKSKYRTMPNITSENMIRGYIPSPRLYITNSPRQRQPRYDYCDLCLTDYDTSSAWIRYNEQRIDQLQKRIDLMLEIDDNEEYQLLLSPDTVTHHIDDILIRKIKRRNQLTSYHNRILLPHRYNFRYPYRSNQLSLPSSPRLLTRNLTRSTKPITKSVRISTEHNQTRIHEPSKIITQPIVSILRRNNTNYSSRSHRTAESSHVWKNDSDGKVYILKQFSIPRYYRLYNDASFREMYNFSRILESYVNQSNSQSYSSIVKNFALDQQLPTITSVA